MRVVGWVAVATLAALAVLSLDPMLVGLSMTTPVAQAIAMRGLAASAFLLLAVLLLLAGAVTGGRRRRSWRTLTLGAVLLLVAGGHTAVIAWRGPASASILTAERPEAAIDVMTLNTQGSAAGSAAIAALVAEHGVDVVALQETTAESVGEIAGVLADEGSHYQVFTRATGPGSVEATALLVSATLGRYEQAEGPMTSFASVRADPVDGVGPVLVSVHPVPPVPGDMAVWSRELEEVLALCGTVPGLVLAGDLNATLDHAALSGAACVDGATAAGGGGVGTWPAYAPRLLGAAIDHVLLDPGAWRASGVAVAQAPAGDHRAVVVRVEPAAGRA